MSAPKYVGSKQARETLGIHFQTLYSWERNGKIEAIKTPGKYNI